MPEVVYELSLKDRFTKAMQEANLSAETLHGTMTSLFTTLGVGFGVYKLVDYFKEARDQVEKIHQAEGQLQAGLVSTNHAAGLAYEDLTEQAEKFSHQFKYTKGEVEQMQAIMLTFPGVTKTTFESASQAILDMSARLHRGSDEIAIMVGKALQDPEKGIVSLRRIGVNFDKEHTDRIKKMIQQGHILEAQAAILKELQTEFAGSAAANAASDPMFSFNKSLEETKEQIGEVFIEIQKKLAPVLLQLAERFRDLVDWLKKNGAELWNVVKALGAAFIAFRAGGIIMASYSALMEGLAAAEVAAATATEGVAAASTAALGPIGLIAAAVGGLVYIYEELANNAKIAGAEIDKMAGANAGAETDYIKGMIAARGGGKSASFIIQENEIAKLTKQVKEAQDAFDSAKSKFAESGMFDNTAKLSADISNKATKLASLKAQLGAAESYSNSPDNISKRIKIAATTQTKAETKGAKGNKAVTINIKIDSLVKELQIKTTNLREGAGKIQEAITQSLMNAVNNSQTIAEH